MDHIRYQPAALTPKLLTEALAAGGQVADAVVTEAVVTPLGTGQMSDSVRVRLTYEDPGAGPETVVAKLPAMDETSRATAIQLGNYTKEVRFYRDLAGSLDVTVPTVFFADIDDTGGDFLLLLADAAPAAQGDQLAGCSPEVAADVVDELVGLHAPRWGDAELSNIDWLHGDPEAGSAFLLSLLPTLWSGFQDRYRTVYSDTVAQQGALVFERLEAYIDATRRVSADQCTVTHGDYRLDNLLLHPDGGSVTVVDWQTVGHGPAIVDLAYFVGAGLLTDDRRAIERALVDRYRKGLAAAGVETDEADCWDGYRRSSFSGLIMAVSASMLVERTDRGDQMFMAMAERHSVQAADLEAADLLV